MQIDIQARNITLTDALRSHAEQRLRSAMNCYDDYIQRVVMQLSGINNPRGSANKCCHLRVVLAGLFDVVVKETKDDLYVAINRATDRAGCTVVRKIDRQQTLPSRTASLVQTHHRVYPGNNSDTGNIDHRHLIHPHLIPFHQPPAPAGLHER